VSFEEFYRNSHLAKGKDAGNYEIYRQVALCWAVTEIQGTYNSFIK